MSITKFIERLLKIKGFCVKDFKFKNRFRELWLEVKPYKNGAMCPYCQKRRKIVYTLDKPRVWLDVPVCGRQVYFTYRPREIECRVHGRIQEDIPWAATNARITYRLEYLLLVYCAIMTQKAAARLLRIAASTMSDLLHRSIDRARQGHKIRNLKMIGIDEISYCKGRKYATVVYDLERSCVVWIGAGKARDTIDRFFRDKLSEY